MIRFRKFCIKRKNAYDGHRFSQFVHHFLCINFYGNLHGIHIKSWNECSWIVDWFLQCKPHTSTFEYPKNPASTTHFDRRKWRLCTSISDDQEHVERRSRSVVLFLKILILLDYYSNFKKERLNLVLISTNSHVAIEFLFLKKPKILWRLQLAQAIIFHCWMRELKLN